jgi:hypothetical protein
MIIEERRNEVEQSGTINTAAFRIDREETAHILGLLSSKLYSNKIQTAIRELCSNAWDAHVAAGTENIPFEVHLPNSLSPEFKVRDFGVSMTNDEVRNHYVRVGFSTKRNSNEQIGAFGIGKLAVLGVTNQFTLTCSKAGIKTVYSVYLDENNLPQIAQLSSAPCIDWTGVEVAFAVNPHQFRDFERELRTVLRFYQKTPAVFGAGDFQVNRPTPSLAGDNWEVTSEGGHILMGNNAYPLESRSLGLDYGSPLYRLVDYLILKLPIGSVAVTPTREAISYTPSTIKAIIKHLEIVRSEIQGVCDKKFENCKTLWEAKELHYQVFNQSADLKSIVDSSVNWRGQTIDNHYLQLPKPLMGEVKINGIALRHNRIRIHRDDSYLPCRSNTTILINDLPTNRVHSRLRGVLANNVNNSVFMLTGDAKKIAALLKEWDLKDTFTRVSTLPRVFSVGGKTVHQGTAQGRASVLRFLESGNAYYQAQYWEPISADFRAGGVYVLTERLHSLIGGKSYRGADLQKCIAALLDAGIQIPNGFIVGIKRKNLPRFQKAKHWVSLEDWMKSMVEQYVTKHNLADILTRIQSRALFNEKELAEAMKALTVTSSGLFSEVQAQFKELSTKSKSSHLDKFNAIKNTAIGGHIPINLTGDDNATLSKTLDAVLVRYPLLAMYGRTYGETKFVKAYAAYIELIDKAGA